MNVTDRRQFLARVLACASPLALPRSAWSQPRLATSPFGLGVASGSPATDSVVLWTRLVQDAAQGEALPLATPVTVRWEVAADEGFARMVRTGQSTALPELGHAVHAEVQGLEPDRPYFYRFMLGGTGQDWVSPTGRTRTLPWVDAPLARLRLAYASCQRWEHGYYSAWRHLVADQPDHVLFLGDYIYEYPTAGRAVRVPPGGWVTTLEQYRQRYAVHKSDPDLQSAHAACPWWVTWDDHEVHNDYAGLMPGDSGPPVADFAARRAAAYQVFYEHMPLRASVLQRALQGLSTGAEMRIYGSARFGQLATLHLLDTRQYRDAQVCSRDGKPGSSTVDPTQCAVWDDPRRSLLGTAQEEWLRQSLGKTDTAWNLLGQQTLLGPRDFRPGPGRLLWNDGWDGYSAARSRLVQSLRQPSVRNPVVLGGDVHENWVGHVKADYERPASANVGVEFCGTSITSRTSSTNAKVAERLAKNPHFVFSEAESRGYGIAEFTPGQLVTTLRVVDDVTKRDSGVRTLARFAVESSRPAVERA